METNNNKLHRRTWQKFKEQTLTAPDTKRVLNILLEPGRVYTGETIQVRGGGELSLLVNTLLLETIFAYEVTLSEPFYLVICNLQERLKKERSGTYTRSAFANMLKYHVNAAILAVYYDQTDLFNPVN